MDYEINLSATEFLYFLDCPQKFRLHRILNPLPYKTDFMDSKSRTPAHYKKRGYKGKKIKGIQYHRFFETFHENYAKIITDSKPSKEIQEDNVKLLFWVSQQEKYLEAKDECYWYPFDKEIRLMTEIQRGKIDCIELCEKKNGLRIIDYKPTPEVNDKLLLLFYANLLNDYRIENPEEDRFAFEVLEVGCYYYEMGVKNIHNVTEVNRKAFEEILKNTQEKILKSEFFLDRTKCWNCGFRAICKIEINRS
jgi:hypothetical protein